MRQREREREREREIPQYLTVKRQSGDEKRAIKLSYMSWLPPGQEATGWKWEAACKKSQSKAHDRQAWGHITTARHGARPGSCKYAPPLYIMDGWADFNHWNLSLSLSLSLSGEDELLSLPSPFYGSTPHISVLCSPNRSSALHRVVS